MAMTSVSPHAVITYIKYLFGISSILSQHIFQYLVIYHGFACHLTTALSVTHHRVMNAVSFLGVIYGLSICYSFRRCPIFINSAARHTKSCGGGHDTARVARALAAEVRRPEGGALQIFYLPRTSRRHRAAGAGSQPVVSTASGAPVTACIKRR